MQMARERGDKREDVLKHLHRHVYQLRSENKDEEAATILKEWNVEPLWDLSMPSMTVMSSGLEAGGHLVVTVNGAIIQPDANSNGTNKGITLVVIDHLTKEVELKQSYDTLSSAEDERKLFQALKTVGFDKIVILAASHDGSKMLKSDTRDLIGTFGSKDITNLRANEPWVFFGGLGKKVVKKEMKRPKGANNFAFIST